MTRPTSVPSLPPGLRVAIVFFAAIAVICAGLAAPAHAAAAAVTRLSAAPDHTCALTATGAVKCWGLDERGQLGDGTTNNSSTPVDVVGLSGGIAEVSAPYSETCSLSTGGAVKGWGYNADGQLGDGTNSESSTPVGVVGLSSGVTGFQCVVQRHVLAGRQLTLMLLPPHLRGCVPRHRPVAVLARGCCQFGDYSIERDGAIHPCSNEGKRPANVSQQANRPSRYSEWKGVPESLSRSATCSDCIASDEKQLSGHAPDPECFDDRIPRR
jgi:Regulator of chromosome condensation (RCC1) repeat